MQHSSPTARLPSWLLALLLMLMLVLVAATPFSAPFSPFATFAARPETFAGDSGLPPCNKVLSEYAHPGASSSESGAVVCQNEWDTPTFFEQTVTVPTANSFAFYDPRTGAQSTIDDAIRTASQKSLDACISNTGIIADVGTALYPMSQTVRKSTFQLEDLRRAGLTRQPLSHERIDVLRTLVASVESSPTTTTVSP
jgi:hypothetical protein